MLHFAELGVVLLLFLIGLELDPQRLWALRRSIFGMGAAQVLATVARGRRDRRGARPAARRRAGRGMALAMSSTAIGLATLQEKNLLATPGGQASFSVLLFQDLAVIPMLLAIGLLGGENARFDWLDAAKGVGLIALVIVGGRFLLRPAAALSSPATQAARGVRRLLAAAGDRHRAR